MLREQILLKIDRTVIDGCETGAEDQARFPSKDHLAEFQQLSAVSQCAVTLFKQWIIDTAPTVELKMVEAAALATLQHVNWGDHVHVKLLQLFNMLLSKEDVAQANDIERAALAHLRLEVTHNYQAALDKAWEHVRNAHFLLEFDPVENEKLAVVMLAQLLDPDVLENL